MQGVVLSCKEQGSHRGVADVRSIIDFLIPELTTSQPRIRPSW